jgi:TetR/AcrR family transcriptional regulator
MQRLGAMLESNEQDSEQNQGGRIRRRNRARIMEAAEEVFAEQGFTGATTAAIAARAGLPKANLHYYFGTKEALYRAVLSGILDLWLAPLAQIMPDANPATALAGYIRAKVQMARDKPLASRVFANEVISGAPVLADYLAQDLKALVDDKAAVLRAWAAQGRMDPIDPVKLLFLIWASTQHYADFDAQVRAVMGRRELTDADFEDAAETITQLVLKGCGIVDAKSKR